MATRKTPSPTPANPEKTPKAPKTALEVATLRHAEDTRKNIPTAEMQPLVQREQQVPMRASYARGPGSQPPEGDGTNNVTTTGINNVTTTGTNNVKTSTPPNTPPPGPLQAERQQRNPDLDPQLVWRGKDQQDWSNLVVNAPPLYIQEKVHPKVLIDDLKRQSDRARAANAQEQQGFVADLFGDMAKDFNGVPEGDAKTEFYQHDAHWSNRMILGDSLHVMASLAEREGLRGKVQCIYFDPPYGIKFNSNFQWSTTSRDVKDGNTEHITREPEMVKAFRDTWRDGIHSYLSYIRDRLTVARDLLTESGSIFVQIGDENVHRVRAVLDEVFGEGNFVSQIVVAKTAGASSDLLPPIADVILWFAKNKEQVKYRPQWTEKSGPDAGAGEYKYVLLPDGQMRPMSKAEKAGSQLPIGAKLFRPSATTSQRPPGSDPLTFSGRTFVPGQSQYWKTSIQGLTRLGRASRLIPRDKSISYLRLLEDFAVMAITNIWADLRWGFDASEKRYVVETNPRVVQRCILMSTDPGDLILDPTCGSGTSAYVAEQWGRRWITIDTSRVALALARARIMGARYPFYLLADSKEGQAKEAEATRGVASTQPSYGNIRHGFVYERVPHITLKSIANNAQIDVIHAHYQTLLEPLRQQLNAALKTQWQEWEIPRQANEKWNDATKKLHAQWWQQRIARQQAMDASIAAQAEFEYLFDRPYEDRKKVRVAGPFTVESLLPHRVLGVDENGQQIDPALHMPTAGYARNFAQIILDNLATAGVQQADRAGKINFASLTPWPGTYICAEGSYSEGANAEGQGGNSKRAAILIGPEFGTVSRPDLVSAAREASDAGFDVLIACAFNYDALSSEFSKLGRIPVLKARMNADLHMADDLKNTGKGNLFVIFGEPDITIHPEGQQIRVQVNGVDVFHPNTGQVHSSNAEEIACWFIDTDYNEESFFVRHAYFLGSGDPYKSLKNTLKAEIDMDAWATLNSDISRPFDKPKSGRIAVKVINHLGDEVMKVFRVG